MVQVAGALSKIINKMLELAQLTEQCQYSVSQNM